jgi:hypothetical protein
MPRLQTHLYNRLRVTVSRDQLGNLRRVTTNSIAKVILDAKTTQKENSKYSGHIKAFQLSDKSPKCLAEALWRLIHDREYQAVVDFVVNPSDWTRWPTAVKNDCFHAAMIGLGRQKKPTKVNTLWSLYVANSMIM